MKIRAKKSLGQYFLNSRHVLDQIISAANIKGGEIVLEIGPGTGVLTTALLKTGAEVVAVEKDDRAVDLIRNKFAQSITSGQLKIIHGDILDENIIKLLPIISKISNNATPAQSVNKEQYSIVANIPYYITGAILEKFLENEPRPTRMILLVQKEVAERIVARPQGNEIVGKESVLSISIKAFGIPRIIAKVPRGAFMPAPEVDSAILEIKNISDERFKEKGIDIKRFFEIVKAGFAHKRKYLKRNLETVISPEKLKEIWQKLALDDKIRAEDLEVWRWFDITKQA